MAQRAKVSTKASRTRPAVVPDGNYDLVLFVGGATERSRSALANAKALAEGRLQGKYRLSVVDLYQQPELARDQEIIAVPTLVKRLPLPLRRVIGDLSDEDRIMVGLDLVHNPPDRSRRKND